MAARYEAALARWLTLMPMERQWQPFTRLRERVGNAYAQGVAGQPVMRLRERVG